MSALASFQVQLTPMKGLGMHSNRSSGFAIVVVLLATSVVLLSVMATAAFMSLGTLRSTNNERVAYQAHLVAESGLNTFLARARTASPTFGASDMVSVDSLNGWLSDTGMDTLSIEGAGSARLNAVAVNGSSFTLESVGVLPGSSARRQILVDMSMSGGNPPRSLRVPAALTSKPSVVVGNNIEVFGRNAATWDGLVGGASGVATTSADSEVFNQGDGGSIPIESADASEFVAGDYIVLGGVTFRVESVGDGALNVTMLGDETNFSVPTGTAIQRVDVGVVSNGSHGGDTLLTVNNPEFLSHGGRIHVDDHVGTVESIDQESGVVTVDWDNAPVDGTLLEGTPVRAEVYGVYTEGQYSERGSRKKVEPIEVAQGSDGTWLPDVENESSPLDTLFGSVFSNGWSEVVGSIPEENRYPNGPNETLMLDNEIVYLGDGNLQQAFCGRGIVIVDSPSAVYNANNACDQPFEGLLYVRGDFRMQGNVVMEGAIVVEGEIVDADDTSVNGSGKNGSRITFNSDVLNDVAQAVPTSGGLEVVAGTYRER